MDPQHTDGVEIGFAKQLQLLRSAGVGIISTLIDLLSLAILIRVFQIAPAAANVPSLLLGIAAQFVGNKLFAFQNKSQGRALAAQGGQFILVESGALLLNALAFQILISLHTPFLPARLAGSALVYFGYSFPLWARIFKEGEAR